MFNIVNLIDKVIQIQHLYRVVHNVYEEMRTRNTEYRSRKLLLRDDLGGN